MIFQLLGLISNYYLLILLLIQLILYLSRPFKILSLLLKFIIQTLQIYISLNKLIFNYLFILKLLLSLLVLFNYYSLNLLLQIISFHLIFLMNKLLMQIISICSLGIIFICEQTNLLKVENLYGLHISFKILN